MDKTSFVVRTSDVLAKANRCYRDLAAHTVQNAGAETLPVTIKTALPQKLTKHLPIQLSLIVNLVVVHPVCGNWGSNQVIWDPKALTQPLSRRRQLLTKLPAQNECDLH